MSINKSLEEIFEFCKTDDHYSSPYSTVVNNVRFFGNRMSGKKFDKTVSEMYSRLQAEGYVDKKGGWKR